jgi:tRNA(Ile)-lysidine synthetase-like protein
MTDLVQQVQRTLRRHAMIARGARVLVAVSGGADSLALLDALRQLGATGGWSLHVATLDHGIRGAAGAADAAFVRDTARAWDLPVTVGRADVPTMAQSAGLGLEASARGVRYAFLLRLARSIGSSEIAVGHTQDDQAETVLLHLIRGSGLRGLRGILPVAPLSEAHIIADAAIVFDPPLADPRAAPDLWPTLVRPLIETSRATIDAYVAARGLEPRQDATNTDPAYLRNRIRHEVLPLLAELNPEIRAGLARTADLLREDADLVEDAAQAALEDVWLESGSDTLVLDQGVWSEFSRAEKRMVLRAAVRWLRPAGLDLAFVHVEDAVRVADGGATGATAVLPDGLALRVEYGTLVIGPAQTDPEDDLAAPLLDPGQPPVTFHAGETASVTCGAWRFEAGPLPPGADVAAIHADPLAAVLCVPRGATLVLRARHPGDRFGPRGMGGRTQQLADTLINMKVPKRFRDRIALVTVDGAIAWFAAPARDRLRGRVTEAFAYSEAGCEGKVAIVLGWRAANK